jgi:hypothetical protein
MYSTGASAATAREDSAASPAAYAADSFANSLRERRSRPSPMFDCFEFSLTSALLSTFLLKLWMMALQTYYFSDRAVKENPQISPDRFYA